MAYSRRDSDKISFGGRRYPDRAVFLGRTYFALPGRNAQPAYEALREFHGYSRSTSGNPRHAIVSMFNWAIKFGVGICARQDDIIEIWPKVYIQEEPEFDKTKRFFQRIGKYVTAHSFVEFVQEGNLSRLYFNGDCMMEQEASTTYVSVKAKRPWSMARSYF